MFGRLIYANLEDLRRKFKNILISHHGDVTSSAMYIGVQNSSFKQACKDIKLCLAPYKKMFNDHILEQRRNESVVVSCYVSGAVGRIVQPNATVTEVDTENRTMTVHIDEEYILTDE